MTTATTESMTTDKLTDDDQAIVLEGLGGFRDDKGLADNPYGPDEETVDERKAMLWRKGFCDGLRAQGRVAFKDKEPIDDCPYDETDEDDKPSEYHAIWREGWLEAQKEILAASVTASKDPFIDHLSKLEDECAAAETAYEQLSKQAKNAKKFFETKVAALRHAVQDAKQPLPLFEQTIAAPKPAEPVPDTAWRQVGIDKLGLTAKVNEKLAGRDVLTIGDLEDLRGGKGLMSIDGIGQATVDKIEDKLLDWLSENRDKAALEAAAVPSEQPAEEDKVA